MAKRRGSSRAKGISIHIGLNTVDPRQYDGWDGELLACENDAKDMAGIAKAAGFKSTLLLTKRATRRAVLGALASAAKAVKSGDIVMVSYSGHGAQVPDMDDEEPDHMDETWCLYDGQVIDDELNAAYSRFAKGVRVLVFSDSCHSGSVVKAHVGVLRASGALRTLTEPQTGVRSEEGPRSRAMPPDVAQRVYREHQKFYDGLQASAKKGSKSMVTASVLLISGCQDNQESSDGTFNGLFTGTLLRVWKQGKFEGSYRSFHKAIGTRMPPIQSPQYFVTGQPDPKFDAQRPFTV